MQHVNLLGWIVSNCFCLEVKRSHAYQRQTLMQRCLSLANWRCIAFQRSRYSSKRTTAQGSTCDFFVLGKPTFPLVHHKHGLSGEGFQKALRNVFNVRIALSLGKRQSRQLHNSIQSMWKEYLSNSPQIQIWNWKSYAAFIWTKSGQGIENSR